MTDLQELWSKILGTSFVGIFIGIVSASLFDQIKKTWTKIIVIILGVIGLVGFVGIISSVVALIWVSK